MVARSSVTGLTKLSENLMLPVGSKRNLIMFHKSMGSLLSKKLGFQYNHMKFATNTNMTVLNVICKQPVRKVGIFYLHPILTKSTPIRYANLNNHNITINSTNVIFCPPSSRVMITIWSQYHYKFKLNFNQSDLLSSIKGDDHNMITIWSQYDHNIIINSTNVICYPLSSRLMITIWSQYTSISHHQFNQSDLLSYIIKVGDHNTTDLSNIASSRSKLGRQRL